LDGLHNRGALRGEELQTDLAEGWRAEGVEQAHRPVAVGDIKGDDDFVLGSGRQFHTMGG
jgi:hypothetical protein